MNLSSYLSKTRHFFRYDVFGNLRRLYGRVLNLIRWFPVIWKDHDWDSSYIYEILKFKLGNQARYIGAHNRHTRAKEDARNMMLCVRLIDKLQDEYYTMEYFDFYKVEYEFIPYNPKPGSYTMKEISIEDNLDEYFKKYYKAYSQIVDKGEHTERRRIAFEIGYNNHEKARKLLFKIIEENIERWWD